MAKPKGGEVHIDDFRACFASQQKWQMTALLYLKMLEELGADKAQLKKIWDAPKEIVVKELWKRDKPLHPAHSDTVAAAGGG